ncbi:MAG: hypothetical protein AAF517_27070, partial [Planctomycetota bacterium]
RARAKSAFGAKPRLGCGGGTEDFEGFPMKATEYAFAISAGLFAGFLPGFVVSSHFASGDGSHADSAASRDSIRPPRVERTALLSSVTSRRDSGSDSRVELPIESLQPLTVENVSDRLDAQDGEFARARIVSELVKSLFEIDLDRALAWVDAQNERVYALGVESFALLLAEHDPEEGWTFIADRFSAHDRYRSVIGQAISRVASRDPASAMEFMERARQDRDLATWRHLGEVLSAWSRRDPISALEGLAKMSPPVRRKHGEYVFRMAWKQDRRAAVDYLLELEDSRYVESLVEKNASFFVSEPELAIELAESLNAESESRFLANVGKQLALRDPVGAIDFAEEMGGDILSEMQPTAVDTLAKLSFDRAMRAAKDIEDIDVRGKAQLKITERLINTASPLEALEFATSIEARSSHSGAVQIAMKSWVREDLEAAERWLEKEPPSRSRDVAVYGFAQALVTEDPERAIRWASTLTPAMGGHVVENARKALDRRE